MVSCGNCLPTFRDKLSVPSLRVLDTIRCPETSIKNYHTTPLNIPEERRSHQYRGGSLKSSKRDFSFLHCVPIGSGAQPASYSAGSRDYFPERKVSGVLS
jgi:hypothetical protein